MGSSLNQRTAEFSLCNTLVLLLDLSFKQPNRSIQICVSQLRIRWCVTDNEPRATTENWAPAPVPSSNRLCIPALAIPIHKN